MLNTMDINTYVLTNSKILLVLYNKQFVKSLVVNNINSNLLETTGITVITIIIIGLEDMEIMTTMDDTIAATETIRQIKGDHITNQQVRINGNQITNPVTNITINRIISQKTIRVSCF
jgi:hypothetical protein